VDLEEAVMEEVWEDSEVDKDLEEAGVEDMEEVALEDSAEEREDLEEVVMEVV